MANTIQYGFIGLQHLFDQRIDLVDVDQIQTAITDTTRVHTEAINELVSTVAEPTTKWQWAYDLPGSGTLQPLDEWGDPKPVSPTGQYTIALPLQRGGDAYGTNRETRALMTVAELNKQLADATRRDADWMRRHMLAAWLSSAQWTYNDERWGNLTVLPLANGDSVVYTLQSGAVTTDNHYLFQNAVIANATNPFPTIYKELAEHPTNSGPFIAYVASDLTDSVEALTALDEPRDPDIVYAANDRTISTGINNNQNQYGPYSGFGERLLGKANGVWVREWAALPSGYIVFHAAGAGRFLGMRQQPAASLQGFFPEFFNVNGNLQLNKFIRICGFGATNRIAAGAMQINAGSYTSPAAFVAPLEL